VRARLSARQTLSGLETLLDDMERRSVGHVGGHDIEKSQVVGRLVIGLQLRGQCQALDGGARALNRDMSVSQTSWHKEVILGRNIVFRVFLL
jgi:hypothetical protein